MKIEVKKFEEITTKELYELLRLRAAVFVVEQNCAYQDLDGKDDKALHILGIHKQELVAYARVFPGGSYMDKASIGRVLVKQNFRTFGFGRSIMSASLKAIEEHYNTSAVQLSAQSYLKKFYNELGFIEVGEGYLEDGIPHILMEKA